MNLLAVFVALPYIAVVVLLGIYFFRRARWRRKTEKGRRGFCPSPLSLGNAFHHLQCFTRPDVRYVLAEKYKEEADEDDSGGPEGDANANLMAQLKRIRRGEDVGELTVRLRG